MVSAARRHPLASCAVGLLLLAQTALGLFQVAESFHRGHNGWNTSAYHQAAKNSWRWGVLFPFQYDTGVTAPRPEQLYSHHPLAMHLHNTLAFGIFGDHTWVVRGVMALQGLLAMLALLLAVWWFWGPWASVVAGATYLATPINAIYLNMANHSSGFIAWGLAALALHLASIRALEAGDPRRARLRHRLFLGAFVLAALWDWPAAYLATAICLHLALLIWRARRDEGDRRRVLLRQLVTFFGTGSLTVGAHVLGVATLAGGMGELMHTAGARTGVSLHQWTHNLKVVPLLVLGWPLLLAGALWFLAFGRRLWRRELRDRDLIPLAFGLGGLLHYGLFRWSAFVHSYWAWTALPFFAIAMAELLPTGKLSGWRRLTSLGGVGVLLLGLYAHGLSLVPAAREVGGSLWFIQPVRTPVPETFHPGYDELRFARRIEAWTDRETGILIHRSIRATVPEPRFTITFDRLAQNRDSLPRTLPEKPLERWAFVASVKAFSPQQRAQLAREHRYRQEDGYFLVDYGAPGPDLEIYRTEKLEPSLAHRFFVSAWDPPRASVRDEAAERALLAQSAAVPR